MQPRPTPCPDCDAGTDPGLHRRDFLRAVGLGAAALSSGGVLLADAGKAAGPTPTSAAETAVKALYESLTDQQRKGVCFDWNHTTKDRGLLRTHVSNNWQITPHHVRGQGFFTKKQEHLIHDVFKGVVNPEWYPKFLKQLRDDTEGKDWGHEQSIAIFGKPGTDQFEFVMTGRHMTIRADGNSTEHVAFGGPIFYGHAAQGFNEKADHPGNVFWPQALAANKIYPMLDGKQRKRAMSRRPQRESEVAFRGDEPVPGLPVADMTADQRAELQKVLTALVEPYRKEDQAEALACLKKQGGLDKCTLTFYQDGDIGDDQVWDNWRLEGPAFVWYFRGAPHVHVWVNIADDPSVKLNARG
jgi:hypothetical protein